MTVRLPLPGLLLMAAMLLGSAAQGQSPKKDAAPPATKVFVEAVRKDMIGEPKTFVGTVKPLRKSIVGSAAPGRVEEYLVNEGDFVKKGQPIAHLRRGIIGAEKRVAEAELDLRKAELSEMEGSFQDEISQTRAKLAGATALHSFNQGKLDRFKTLKSSVSKEEVEELISLAARSQAAVDEANASLRLLTGGVREQKNEQARARVAMQTAEVERLTEQFDRHTMFAPFDGYVTAELTEVGQWVMQGDPAAEIAELDQVDVEIGVLEDYVSRLSTSAGGDIDVPAIRDRHFLGAIAVIVPQADARARTFPVKVRVDNEIGENGPLLKAGMFARVTLPVGEPVEVQLIPKDAVVLGGRYPVVYVVDTAGGKSTVRPVTVTLGASNGLWISVGPGELKTGELVVIEGNERLRPMQEVRTERKQIDYAKAP